MLPPTLPSSRLLRTTAMLLYEVRMLVSLLELRSPFSPPSPSHPALSRLPSSVPLIPSSLRQLLSTLPSTFPRSRRFVTLSTVVSSPEGQRPHVLHKGDRNTQTKNSETDQ